MNWKKYLADYAFLLGIALTIIVLDQLTKAWVRDTLTIGEVYRPDLWLSQYVRILHWHNTGAAFGTFQGWGNVFAVLAVFVCAAILYYFPQVPREEWLLRPALALQLAGAAGNLIDRITIGHVTDFVSVGNFPVFNVADASISTGVALLLVGMWLHEKGEKQRAQASAAAAAQTEHAGSLPASAETVIAAGGDAPADAIPADGIHAEALLSAEMVQPDALDAAPPAQP